MKSKKIYVLTILLMFFLTVSCAYATESQTEDAPLLASDIDEVALSSSADDQLLGSSARTNEDSLASAPGINYEDLVVKDINFTGDSTHLNIEGFSQNGLSMSDFTMSIIPSSDKFEFDMSIPEVQYTDNNSTAFIFKNLDLSILPSSNPSTLDFSAVMDSLELITGNSYINLQDLKLFFNTYPEVNGVAIAIDMSKFMYDNFYDTKFSFEDLDFDLAIGLDGQALFVSAILPTLNLVNNNNKVDLTDLDLSVKLPDLKLANLNVTVLMSDFRYSDPEDVSLNMTDLALALVPVLNSTTFNTIIHMSSFNFTGLNSSDFQFPGFNITGLDFENFSTGLDLSNVDLSGIVSILDVSKMDLASLVSYLSSGFDITTYTDNMPGQYESSLDFNGVDMSSISLSDLNFSGINMSSIFSSGDFSSLNSSVLNLTGLFASAGIDPSEFGIDVSKYDFSAITISEIQSILNDPDFNMSAITSKLDFSNLDLGGLDVAGLISSFDLTSFNMSSILALFNISGTFDFSAFMNGFDLNKLLNLFQKQNTTPENTTPVVPAPKSIYPVKYAAAYSAPAPKTFTVTRLSDHQVICKNTYLFILEFLNKLFNATFINGHLKVYIDGELVFEGDTTDDLTQVIFEIVEKYLGEHEITVEFTDSNNKTKTYKEKIMVE